MLLGYPNVDGNNANPAAPVTDLIDFSALALLNDSVSDLIMDESGRYLFVADAAFVNTTISWPM